MQTILQSGLFICFVTSCFDEVRVSGTSFCAQLLENRFLRFISPVEYKTLSCPAQTTAANLSSIIYIFSLTKRASLYFNRSLIELRKKMVTV